LQRAADLCAAGYSDKGAALIFQHIRNITYVLVDDAQGCLAAQVLDRNSIQDQYEDDLAGYDDAELESMGLGDMRKKEL
jgi:hypothetical protein